MQPLTKGLQTHRSKGHYTTLFKLTEDLIQWENFPEEGVNGEEYLNCSTQLVCFMRELQSEVALFTLLRPPKLYFPIQRTEVQRQPNHAGPGCHGSSSTAFCISEKTMQSNKEQRKRDHNLHYYYYCCYYYSYKKEILGRPRTILEQILKKQVPIRGIGLIRLRIGIIGEPS